MPDARRGCHGNAQTRSERSAEGRGSEALSRELSLGFRWARAEGADGAGLPAAAGPVPPVGGACLQCGCGPASGQHPQN